VYDGVMDFTLPNVPEGALLGEPQPIMDEAEWVADHAAVTEQYDRMSDSEWPSFVSRQQHLIDELDAIEEGGVDPERSALNTRVMAFADEHGISYTEALSRVLDKEECF
jgi:hypothetical protein